MSACRRFHVSGRVQGVFFRESTRRQAERLGLTGYALNLADGRVEVLACGEESALDELAKWLGKGPSAARVDNLQSTPADETPPPQFRTG